MRAHKDCGMLWSGSVLYIFGVVGRPRSCRWSGMVCMDLSCLLFGVFWGIVCSAFESWWGKCWMWLW